MRAPALPKFHFCERPEREALGRSAPQGAERPARAPARAEFPGEKPQDDRGSASSFHHRIFSDPHLIALKGANQGPNQF